MMIIMKNLGKRLNRTIIVKTVSQKQTEIDSTIIMISSIKIKAEVEAQKVVDKEKGIKAMGKTLEIIINTLIINVANVEKICYLEIQRL
jgi:hypothetical protein